MGTWDTGPFDNDSAYDAVTALVNGTFRMDQFRFECGLGSLGTDEAQSVIALAAVINGYSPSELEGAVDYPFTLDDKRWIRRRAQAALRPGGSALYSMWEDAGELEQWLAAARKYTSKPRFRIAADA